MARPATGSVVEPKGDRRSYGIRFRALGKRRFLTLGRPEDGWTREKAEEALHDELERVRLGVWKEEEVASPVAEHQAEETFREFASAWFHERKPDWAESSQKSVLLAWKHLFPTFGEMRLSEITKRDIDRFMRAKQAEGRLGNNSVNMHIQHMAACLERAVDWELIQRNPAKGRRLPSEPPKRIHIEPEQLPSLLRGCKPHIRKLVEVLAGCGLRIGEACALTWADVHFATGIIDVKDAKTVAGIRKVDMPVEVAATLRHYKAVMKPAPTDAVFLGVYGRSAQTPTNAELAFKTAIKAANKELERKGLETISLKASPHSCRRLFASLKFAGKADPVYVCEQGGWTDPTFAIKVYAKAVRRRERLSGDHLEEFDAAVQWARLGTNDDLAIAVGAAQPLPERASETSYG